MTMLVFVLIGGCNYSGFSLRYSIANYSVSDILFLSSANPLDSDHEGTGSEIAYLQTFHFYTPKYKSEIWK